MLTCTATRRANHHHHLGQVSGGRVLTCTATCRANHRRHLGQVGAVALVLVVAAQRRVVSLDQIRLALRTTTSTQLVSDSTRRSLRSADVSTCVVTPTLSSYGDRTFAAAGPRLWNSLPVQLRNPDITYGLFRRQLKGHHFREA